MLERQPFAGEKTGLRIHLRILETTDLHVHILPYDYFIDKPAPAIGLARTARLIRRARDEAANCLLFDNGDFLQGNPLSDWAFEHGRDETHPMIAAMNMLGYDAATLGNHEFNYGLDLLCEAVEEAAFPIVSANVARRLGKTPLDDTTLVPPWKILERDAIASDGSLHRIRIGVIGFAPPQIPIWEHFTLRGEIVTRDIVEAAQAHVPALKATGADVIVALSHSGIGNETHMLGMENASVPLAAVHGIDAVLTGHTHGVFPSQTHVSTAIVDSEKGTLHGVPAVMAGYHGSHLGVIDLQLIQTDSGWRSAAHAVQSWPISPDYQDDPIVSRTVEHAHQSVLKLIRKPLANLQTRLTTHFAQVAPCPAMTLLSDAMSQAARLELFGRPEAALPLLTAVAPHKAGGHGRPDNYMDVPPGPLAVRHASELYPFPNALSLLVMSGAHVAQWLERAATAYLQIQIGETDQPLLDPKIPSYHCDVIFGLTYEIDPSRPIGRRIGAIRLADGRPLVAGQEVVLATNSYRAGGGGGYAAAQEASPIANSERSIRDILISYLREQKSLSVAPTDVWRFAPLPRTEAWFDTSPDANAPGSDQLIDRGLTPPGYRRFSLRFSDC